MGAGPFGGRKVSTIRHAPLANPSDEISMCINSSDYFARDDSGRKRTQSTVRVSGLLGVAKP